jgi:protein-S-isoprenylcysteine O-methyltransferase Ste14
MTWLELRIPPLVVLLIFAVTLWVVSRLFPYPAALSLIASISIAIILAGLGALIALAGVRAFRAHGTTVNPLTPEATTSVVDTGIYRYTRNPMYLGFFLALGAWSVLLMHPAALLALPAFIAYLNAFQIQAEERTLTTLFGESYVTYQTKVRRWL